MIVIRIGGLKRSRMGSILAADDTIEDTDQSVEHGADDEAICGEALDLGLVEAAEDRGVAKPRRRGAARGDARPQGDAVSQNNGG